jgi:hypothetical protein
MTFTKSLALEHELVEAAVALPGPHDRDAPEVVRLDCRPIAGYGEEPVADLVAVADVVLVGIPTSSRLLALNCWVNLAVK